MFSTKYGIEIEFTGITRLRTARVVERVLGGEMDYIGGYLSTYIISLPDGREWKVMQDESIVGQKKEDGEIICANHNYRVELVSPILSYDEDIAKLQELIGELKKAGGFTNDSCGLHIHLDGEDHTPRSLRNFINLVASKNDLFYRALKIPKARQYYCKKMDERLVKRLNDVKPETMEELEYIWYWGYMSDNNLRPDKSRYHFLNLHSFFHGNYTVELRGFNSELDADRVKAYIVFALAINHQALTQKCVHYQKFYPNNERFAMRTYLVRIGLSGDEFKDCRHLLYQSLS